MCWRMRRRRRKQNKKRDRRRPSGIFCLIVSIKSNWWKEKVFCHRVRDFHSCPSLAPCLWPSRCYLVDWGMRGRNFGQMQILHLVCIHFRSSQHKLPRAMLLVRVEYVPLSLSLCYCSGSGCSCWNYLSSLASLGRTLRVSEMKVTVSLCFSLLYNDTNKWLLLARVSASPNLGSILATASLSPLSFLQLADAQLAQLAHTHIH